MRRLWKKLLGGMASILAIPLILLIASIAPNRFANPTASADEVLSTYENYSCVFTGSACPRCLTTFNTYRCRSGEVLETGGDPFGYCSFEPLAACVIWYGCNQKWSCGMPPVSLGSCPGNWMCISRSLYPPDPDN